MRTQVRERSFEGRYSRGFHPGECVETTSGRTAGPVTCISNDRLVRSSSLIKHTTINQNVHKQQGGHSELSSFSQAYTEYAGGGGQWPLYAFLNVDCDGLYIHMESLKIYIFKVHCTLLGGRGHKKECSVYAFDNVNNSG